MSDRRWGDRRWGRRRAVLVGVGVVAVAAVAATTGARLTSGDGPSGGTTRAALATATVRRTDLAQTTPVTGVVAFAGPGGAGDTGAQPIVQAGGTAPWALDQHRRAVAAAAQALAADRQAADDGGAADAQALAQAQQAVAAAQARSDASAAAVRRDQPDPDVDDQQLAADEAQAVADAADVDAARAQLGAVQVAAAQHADQAQAKVAADELVLAGAQAVLSAAQASQGAFEATSRYTALPAVGQVVEPGQALWSVDGTPVVLLPGPLTPWRAFAAGMAPGPDVAALHQALIELGHGAGLRPSDRFTAATAAAIGRLQAALGVPRTGVLPLGSVAFQPAGVRIAAVHAQLGAPVVAGAAVVDVTSTTPVIDVALPVEQSYLVAVGDPVSVTLPDRTTGDGTITAVGSVASTAAADDAASGSQPSSTPPKATIRVTVMLTKADGAARLDQAPVTVSITSARVTDVLAVPTTALVALAGGGYAVEVVGRGRGHPHRLVAVTTGIFDDQSGLVQVSGDGLAAGQTVVAPA